VNIPLYSPDNGVTRNFMPHLWMFLLKSLTPREHEVLRQGWTRSFSPETSEEGLRRMADRPFQERALMFFARLAFRGIHFLQMTVRHWLILLWRNHRRLFSLSSEAFQSLRTDTCPSLSDSAGGNA
jgi:hypothetical protein